MHNAKRTEVRLNYSIVSGLTPSSAHNYTCRFQARPLLPFGRFCIYASFVLYLYPRCSLHAVIGAFFLFRALLSPKPPPRDEPPKRDNQRTSPSISTSEFERESGNRIGVKVKM